MRYFVIQTAESQLLRGGAVTTAVLGAARTRSQSHVALCTVGINRSIISLIVIRAADHMTGGPLDFSHHDFNAPERKTVKTKNKTKPLKMLLGVPTL